MKHILLEGNKSVVAYLPKYEEVVCWLKNKTGEGHTQETYYFLEKEKALQEVIKTFAKREGSGHFELVNDKKYSLIIEQSEVTRCIEETNDIYRFKGISQDRFLMQIRKEIDSLTLQAVV